MNVDLPLVFGVLPLPGNIGLQSEQFVSFKKTQPAITGEHGILPANQVIGTLSSYEPARIRNWIDDFDYRRTHVRHLCAKASADYTLST